MSDFGPGTIVIPSDADVARAGVLINAASAAILRDGLALGDGEPGALLSSGIFAVEDGSFVVNVFSPTFTTLGTLTPFGGANPNITSNWSDRFYAVQNGGGVVFCGVKSFNASGTVGGTTWTLDTKVLPSIAVSDDATSSTGSLYYSASNELKVWNLATNASGGTLGSGVANGLQRDLLKIPGQAILIGILQTAPGVYVLRWLSTADGSTIRSVSLSGNAGNGSAPRLSLDVGNTAAFWVRTFQDGTGTTSNLAQYRVSDGSVLSTLDNVPTGTTTGTVPLSCPFVAWSGVAEVFIGTRQTLPIRRERTVPIPVLPGNARQKIVRLELQFQPGTGLPADPTTSPQFFVRMSWDNGKTWSNERLMQAGREGAYITRAFVNLLGAGLFPVVQIVTSDTFLPVLTNAFFTGADGVH